MSSEYIRFEKNEKRSIQKGFLNSQLLLLDSLKKYTNYRRLRGEELLLKISLKTKIEQLNNEIKNFEKYLPKTVISEKEISKIDEKSKNYSLEEEIFMIKQKLAVLNSHE